MAIEGKMIENEVIIDVSDVYKSFRVYFDKSSMLKERFVNPGRSYYENRDILKGISFKVYRGETVALIGHNGCGKSTTLKMLTKILYPNKGTVTVKGKVSSLIELGAGFHPDMSGRENIYINGSVLGLNRDEVDKRIDDIIRFSELEDFIDNPIRTYSSGMYMRLAFSVAINVDADILIIDEILAVGDQSFQEKCIKKLDELRKNGVTVVLVSHSMGQVQDIADRCIWIDDGRIVEDGSTDVVCEHYNHAMEQVRLQRDIEEERQKKEVDTTELKEAGKTQNTVENVFGGIEEGSSARDSKKQPIDLKKFLSEKMQGKGMGGSCLVVLLGMLLFMFSIAIQDIYGMGTGPNIMPREELTIKMQLSAFTLLGVSRLSVPLLLIYLGYFYMKDGFDFTQSGILSFYKAKLLPLVCIWEVCVVLYRIWLFCVYGMPLDVTSITKQLLFIEVVPMTHGWFPRILIVGIVLMPFMWKILTSMKFETMRLTLVLSWIFLFLFSGFDLYGQANGAASSIPSPFGTLCYLFYICMGFYLSLYHRRLIRGSREVLVIALCYILTVFSGIFIYARGVDYIIWYTFYSVSIMAFLSFDVVARFRLPGNFQRMTGQLAKCSVVAFIIFRPIQQLLLIQINRINGKFMMKTCLLFGLSAAISYFLAYGILKFYEYIMSR